MSTDEDGRIEPSSSNSHERHEVPAEWLNLSKAQKQRILVDIRRILLAKEPK